MASLYNLAERYKSIANLLDDETMNEEVITTALMEINGSIVDKATNIAGLTKDLQSDIEAIKAEEKRLADRRRFAENKVRWLKAYVQDCMETTGQSKIKTPLFTFTLQKNPPSVEVDMSKLPKKYIVETISQAPDKAAIKAAMKAGEDVPGAVISQGVSLRIK